MLNTLVTVADREAVDGRATRWAGHRARRRAEIVAAALVAVKEHGPDVSTEQIAERAGIPRPRLYRHFTDAEDLHDAVAQCAADLLIAEIAPTLTGLVGTPRGIIVRIVDTFVTWMTENVSLYHYVVNRATGGRTGGNRVVADARTTVSGMLRDFLERYCALLGIDPVTVDPLAFGLVGMVESATQRWLVAPGVLGREALVDQVSIWIWGLLDHILRSIGVVVDPDEPLPPVT
jgi:AcrR family transcriptional regulator